MSPTDFSRVASTPAKAPTPPAGIVRTCMRAATVSLRWKPLVLWLLLLAAPTLLGLFPIWRLMAQQLDHTLHSSAWAHRLDLLMLADLAERFGQASPVLPASLLGSAVLLVLLQPLLAAVFVASARSTKALPFGALLHAGLTGYGRMLRLFIWGVPVLGLAALGGAGLDHLARKFGEAAILQADADHARWAAGALAALLFIVARATLDAAQAQFAFDETRRSAFLAWWHGLKLIVRHPVRTLSGNVLLTLVGAALLTILGLVRIELATFSGGGFVLGVLLTQCLALLPGWTHGARLNAMLSVLRASQSNRSRAVGLPRPQAMARSMADYS